MTDYEGYMLTASYDDETLTLTAHNKMSRNALFGVQSLAAAADRAAERAEAAGHVEALPRLSHDGNEVAVPRAAITSVEFKKATALGNGELVVHTVDGKKYRAHFRRKQSPAFSELADRLK